MRQGYRTVAGAFHFVVPAKAGTHFGNRTGADEWVPTFAGTTTELRRIAGDRLA